MKDRYISICSIAALTIAMLCNVYADSSVPTMSSYRWHTYAWLLTADDPGRIKLGAKSLESTATPDIKLADLAAKVIWEYTQGQRNLDPDTIAWLARAIATTKSKRYFELLRNLASAHPGKIADYATAAAASLSTPGDAFNPEDVKLGETRSALVSTIQSAMPTPTSLYELTTGAWIEDVFTKLGYPQDVAVVMRSRRAPAIGHVSVANMLLDFGDKGVVELNHDQNEWYVEKISPRVLPRRSVDANAGEERYYIDLNELRHGISNADPKLMRTAAMQAYRLGIADKTFLDLAAWRLNTDMTSEDASMVDGLAYLCQILGNSANPSYRDLVTQVSRQAKSKKLRKFAAVALKHFTDVPGEPRAASTPPTMHETETAGVNGEGL